MENYKLSLDLNAALLIFKDNPTIKQALELEELTPDQIFEANKAYNENSWREKINRFTDMDAVFFRQKDKRSDDYDRYFVLYKTDGVKFFAQFGYGSILSSGGFVGVTITNDNHVLTHEFNNDGQTGRLSNHPKNREYMRRSGLIFSNGL